MAEQIAVDLIINTGQTATTVKEIKQSLKDIKNAALEAGEGSKDFVKLTNAAAQLKDKLEDVNDGISALDPGKLGQQFARLGSSIAGGFQAAQGAMALFGNTGEDVQKALLKVQAATAFAQGIQSVQDLGKAFKGFFLVLKANPFALYLTAVTALVAALVALKDKVKVIGDAFDSIVQSYKDFSDSIGLTNFKLTESFDAAIDKANELNSVVSKNADYQKSLAQAQGKSSVEIAQITIDANNKLIDSYKEAVTAANALIKENRFSAEERAKLKLLEDKAIEADKENKILLAQLETEGRKESEEKEKESQKTKLDNNKKYLDDLEAQKKLAKQQDLDRFKSEKQAEMEAYAEAKAQQDVIDAAERKKIEDSDAADILQGQIRAQRRADELQAAKDLAAAKLSIEQSTFSAVSSLGSIFINDSKKLEKFNKAQALIQLGVDTAKAIGSLTAASAANPTNAITFGAAGIAQFASGLALILSNIAKAKQILSSGGTSSPSLGGGGATASSGATPNIRPVGNIQTQLPQDQIENSNKGQTLRAYVVETEISDSQRRINAIKNKSTFP